MVRTHGDPVFKLILSTFLLVGSFCNDSRQSSVPTDRIHIIYSVCVMLQMGRGNKGIGVTFCCCETRRKS
jgi:hypothetical protein